MSWKVKMCIGTSLTFYTFTIFWYLTLLLIKKGKNLIFTVTVPSDQKNFLVNFWFFIKGYLPWNFQLSSSNRLGDSHSKRETVPLGVMSWKVKMCFGTSPTTYIFTIFWYLILVLVKKHKKLIFTVTVPSDQKNFLVTFSFFIMNYFPWNFQLSSSSRLGDSNSKSETVPLRAISWKVKMCIGTSPTTYIFTIFWYLILL